MKNKKWKVVETEGFKKDLARLGLDDRYKPTLKERVVWFWQKVSDYPRQGINEIRYFIQRGKRGYSDRDVWDLDYYITIMLIPALKQIGKEVNSYPSSPFDKRVAANRKFKCLKDWQSEIGVMVKGFEAAKKISYMETDPKEIEKLQKEYDIGMDSFKKWYFNLWT